MAEEREERETYEIKDKRRFNPDGTPRESAEPPEKTAEAQTDEVASGASEPSAGSVSEGAGRQAEPAESRHESSAPGEQAEAPPPDVYAVLHFVFGLVAEQAWQLMGIHLPPGRKEPFKDMAQAKVAIDTAVFIADKLQPHLSEEQRRTIRTMISDLQMNFVART